MRALVIAAAGSLALLASPALAASRSFVLSSFDNIEVVGDAVVELHSNAPPGARAEGAPRDLDRVRLVRGGSGLVVRLENPTLGGDARPSAPVRIIIGTRRLSEASVRGAGQLSIDRLDSQSARLIVAGAGSLRVGQLKADRLTLTINGSGRIAIGGGKAGIVAVQQLGPGTLDAAGLTAQSLTLNQQGSATTRLAVDGPATLTASGAGLIELGGAPRCIRQGGTGSASVRCGGLPARAAAVETGADAGVARPAPQAIRPAHRKPPPAGADAAVAQPAQQAIRPVHRKPPPVRAPR